MCLNQNCVNLKELSALRRFGGCCLTLTVQLNKKNAELQESMDPSVGVAFTRIVWSETKIGVR